MKIWPFYRALFHVKACLHFFSYVCPVSLVYTRIYIWRWFPTYHRDRLFWYTFRQIEEGRSVVLYVFTKIMPYVPKSCASYKCHNFRSICPTQKIRYVLSSSQQYLSFEMTYEEIGAFLTDLKIFDFWFFKKCQNRPDFHENV